MKKLLSVLLCILLLAGCAQTYDGPTEDTRVLSESYTDIYYLTFGTLATTHRTVYSYDIYGNLVREMEYIDGEANTRTDRTFDENGNVLKESRYDLEGWFPKLSRREENTYDDRGLLTTRVLRTGGEKYVYSYTYDDRGRMLTYDHDGEIATFVYDDEANTETFTDSDGDVRVRQYDEQGNLLRQELTNSDGTVILEEYTLRPDGQMISCRTSENGVLTRITEYTYDDQGCPVLCTVTEDGNTRTSGRWEYTENSKTVWNSDGSYFVSQYDTDGSLAYQHSYTQSGELMSQSTYYYTEIRVPTTGKEEP